MNRKIVETGEVLQAIRDLGDVKLDQFISATLTSLARNHRERGISRDELSQIMKAYSFTQEEIEKVLTKLGVVADEQGLVYKGSLSPVQPNIEVISLLDIALLHLEKFISVNGVSLKRLTSDEQVLLSIESLQEFVKALETMVTNFDFEVNAMEDSGGEVDTARGIELLLDALFGEDGLFSVWYPEYFKYLQGFRHGIEATFSALIYLKNIYKHNPEVQVRLGTLEEDKEGMDIAIVDFETGEVLAYVQVKSSKSEGVTDLEYRRDSRDKRQARASIARKLMQELPVQKSNAAIGRYNGIMDEVDRGQHPDMRFIFINPKYYKDIVSVFIEIKEDFNLPEDGI